MKIICLSLCMAHGTEKSLQGIRLFGSLRKVRFFSLRMWSLAGWNGKKHGGGLSTSWNTIKESLFPTIMAAEFFTFLGYDFKKRVVRANGNMHFNSTTIS